jgi:type II secretory ATPase GspE/PulE/Tfp pilus assembly ATPase PilB-like protein
MGIPNDVLGSSDFFAGMIYQSLVQVLCKNCCKTLAEQKEAGLSKKQDQVIARVYKVLPDSDIDKIRFRDPNGCENCESGIQGRTVIAEVVFPTPSMKQHFANAEDHKAEAEFIKGGGMLVIHAGIEKLRLGQVDALDLEHKVGRIDTVLDLVKMSGLGMKHFEYRSEQN